MTLSFSQETRLRSFLKHLGFFSFESSLDLAVFSLSFVDLSKFVFFFFCLMKLNCDRHEHKKARLNLFFLKRVDFNH